MPVPAELTTAVWHKSSRSSQEDPHGDCVEVAFLEPGVAVRDSKRPEGGALILPSPAWRHFLRTLD